ncbi:MAG: right-handed parallel beta-helix repeat-containing protein [Paludibacter sp.]|nr:right-handed parallel beta-helix repeat-containing protein [Paludibacter sp.]
MKRLNFTLLALLVGTLATVSVAQTNYYAKPVASGEANGLSWENALTLNAALSVSVSGDIIHLAAGKYTPSVSITGGTDDLDMTFEIKNNITLVGGYPTNPTVSDIPSTENETVLDGEIAEGYNAYHVVAITALAEEGEKVELRNISITGGKPATTGTALIVNELSYVRTSGGAIIIGGAALKLENCRIYDNTGHNCPGLFAFSNSKVTINDCVFENNIGGGNGASMWIDASNIDVFNSSFIGNKNTGVGAIQIIANAKANFYNSTIANNVSGYNHTTTSRNGSGIYIRNGSQVQVVNCTIYGNESNGNGAGIALHTTTAFTGTSVDVVSTTIANNKSLLLDNSTAGIFALTTGCAVNIHNSIVSGNTAKGSTNYDVAVTSGTTLLSKNSIIADKVFDGAGSLIADVVFDRATMLDTLANNGGDTETVQLLLENSANPARTYGVTTASLITLGSALSPAIPESIVAFDQLGNSRTANIMGAWTANAAPLSVSENNASKPLVYVSDSKLWVQSENARLITVFNIAGQRIAAVKPVGSLTSISNLSKGNIFIVNVDGKNSKVIF